MEDTKEKGAHLPEGTLLQGGKYRIVRFIGSGGFGCTYEAEHTELKEKVAIKEFFVKDFCNRDGETSRITVGTESKRPLVTKLLMKFKDEARSLYRLRHPGIVRVSDVFEENGTAYYVMDYIEGHSLQDVVKAEGRLTEDRSLKYIREVSEALSYVHSHNRLHLDIKPGNIMIDGNDHAILIDFGASKQYDEASGENTSTLMGRTPGYAPPEQMSNKVGKFLPATDIYALGATLYKCLSGETPPDSTDLISGEELVPLPSTVHDSTRRAVSAAMELNKGRRPQSVNEFLAILDGSFEPDRSEESTFLDTGIKKTKFRNEHHNAACMSHGMGKENLEEKSLVNVKEKAAEKILESESESQSSRKSRFLRFGLVTLCVVAGVLIGFLLLRPVSEQDNASPEVALDSLKAEKAKSDSVRRREFFMHKRDSIRAVEAELRSREATALEAAAASEAAMKRMQDSLTRLTEAREGRGKVNGHEWIDLGLSVKWATCNVGANSPSDYGSYYAWGETSVKSTYTDANSKTYDVQMDDISGNALYDVARSRWGGSWRLPTREEMEELVVKCRWEWSSQDSHNGYQVTGPNGASIFLPASGWCYGTTFGYAGEVGNYWASSPYSTDGAFYLYFDSTKHGVEGNSRNGGFTVRPVKD